MLNHEELKRLAQLVCWTKPEWFQEDRVLASFALLNKATWAEFQNKCTTDLVHIQRSSLGLVVVKREPRSLCSTIQHVYEHTGLKEFRPFINYNFLNPIMIRDPWEVSWFRLSPTEFNVQKPTAHQSMQAEVELENWLQELQLELSRSA